MKNLLAVAAAAVTACVYTGAAQAAVVITINQVGADVIARGSGSLNLTDIGAEGAFDQTPLIDPSLGIFLSTNNPEDGYNASFSGAANYGAGGSYTSFVVAGDAFGFNAPDGDIFLPHGYVSNAPLDFTATFGGQTLASLGLTPGSHVFTIDSVDPNSITVNVGLAPVPLPASAPLFGAALLALAAAGLGKKQRPSAEA